MPSLEEESIVLRRFDGTNILLDSAYLGPTYLRVSQNWIPGDTFRLTKRPGATLLFSLTGTSRVQKLLRCYNTAGTIRYLYLVLTPLVAGVDQVDELWVSINDAAPVHVTFTAGGNVLFTQVQGTYDLLVFNGIVYCGNGVDPIVSVPVGGTATNLLAVTAFTDTEAAPTLNADTGSQILSGTYAYAWCIFDHTNNIWVERGTTQNVTVRATGDQSISFPLPTGMVVLASPPYPSAWNPATLSAQFKAHLFVAPINLPIEFAHDQTPEGVTAAATVLRAIVADGPPLPLRGVARTGNIFRDHLGRLLIAGDQAERRAVWGSYLLVPGNEQAVFNAGLFWPVNARLPRTDIPVSALGLATTGELNDPTAALVVTTISRTYIALGDLLDDPSQEFRQVSQRAGCISAATMVETPFGVLYCGINSVYLVPAGGGAPIDVGWPIRPSIQAIPVGQRTRCLAFFHKGFYKLYIVPAGQAIATQSWWLDLRRGIQDVPSWWGPHVGKAYSAATVGQQDPVEPDRAIGATESDGAGNLSVEFLHQLNSVKEDLGAAAPLVLVALFQTGDLDNGRPFDRKKFTRLRATGFPQAMTTMAVSLLVDGASMAEMDPLVFPGVAGAQWNVDQWNVGQWGQISRVEAESITGGLTDADRPRGVTASVQLLHTDPVPIAFRDFELRYLPVRRPTRTVATDAAS